MKTVIKIIASMLILAIIAGSTGYVLFHFLVTPPSKNPAVSDDDDHQKIYNILCCGVDKEQYNADTIVLMTYFVEKNKVKVLSLPRDTMSHVQRTIKKLNASYSDPQPGDIEETKKEVTMLTGIPIDRFVVTTFDGFKNIINALGGVEMDVPEPLHYSDPYQDLLINIDAGPQVLDGDKALQFVRFRAGYAEGDLGRIKAQHLFFKALGKTMLNPSNITKAPEIAKIVRQDMKTDLTIQEIVWFARHMKGLDLNNNIVIFTLPGYPMYVDELSYYIPDAASIVYMLNKEYPKDTPWTIKDLDLVPQAMSVQASNGYGSSNPDKIPRNLNDNSSTGTLNQNDIPPIEQNNNHTTHA